MKSIHFVLAVSALTALAAAAQAQDVTTVIRAAKVIDGRGQTIANGDIVVTGSRITRVGARGAVPTGARVIDLGIAR